MSLKDKLSVGSLQKDDQRNEQTDKQAQRWKGEG
jgi:hypothetical protein